MQFFASRVTFYPFNIHLILHRDSKTCPILYIFISLERGDPGESSGVQIKPLWQVLSKHQGLEIRMSGCHNTITN